MRGVLGILVWEMILGNLGSTGILGWRMSILKMTDILEKIGIQRKIGIQKMIEILGLVYLLD